MSLYKHFFYIVIITFINSSKNPAASRLVTETLIKLIMVLGLYIFIGNSGIMSFGHGSFMIIGAYASAWLTIPGPMKKVILPDLPVFIQTLSFDPGVAAIISICVCVIFAFIVGISLLDVMDKRDCIINWFTCISYCI